MLKKTIKVMLVDDHEIVRMGLTSLLAMYPHIEIVAVAANATQCMAMVVESKPDVILLDIRLPDTSGIEICRSLKQKIPVINIIMLTSYDDEKFIQDSFLAGASGYVLKEICTQNLLETIESVQEGKTMLDPKITGKIYNKIKETNPEEPMYNNLTKIEKQILFYISKGLKNKEISKQLNLKETTVRNYKCKLLDRLNLRNRAEAVAFVVRHHLDQTN